MVISPFQSTLPVWGATLTTIITAPPLNNFNPRSPCGERQVPPALPFAAALFQSTLPVWGATLPFSSAVVPKSISIHAPRVGSDAYGASAAPCAVLISIHAPRVGSDSTSSHILRRSSIFQSTLPVWGATASTSKPLFALTNFNPRSPCGERPKMAKI